MGLQDLTQTQPQAQNPQQLEQAHGQLDQLLQIISTIKDQASYDAAKQQYQQMGGHPEDLPAQYNPQEVQQFAQQIMQAKQQMGGQAQAPQASGIGGMTGGAQWP